MYNPLLFVRRGDIFCFSLLVVRRGVVVTCDGFGIVLELSRTNVRHDASFVSSAPTLRNKSPTMLRADRRDWLDEFEWMEDIEDDGEVIGWCGEVCDDRS